MFGLEQLVIFLVRGFCVGLAASITVGPVAVLCIQRTLSKSRSAGLVSGAGVACADTLMAVIAFFFYSLLEAQIKEYAVLLQVCGGLFVIAVGVYIFFQNPVPQIRRNRAGKSSSVQDFVSIFWFTLANFVIVIPYLLAFFAMFGSIGANAIGAAESDSMAQGILTIFGFFGGALTWWFLLTSLISLFRRKFRPRHMLTINRIAGVVITLLGVYTVLSTFINIMPDVH